jgi:hypothetical protein
MLISRDLIIYPYVRTLSATIFLISSSRDLGPERAVARLGIAGYHSSPADRADTGCQQPPQATYLSLL